MAGNTVYVQGSYVDVHDNEVVNLSIDKAGAVHVGDGQQTKIPASTAVPGEEDDGVELFHFIHPSVPCGQERQVHNEVARLVRRQGIQEICAYLKRLADDHTLLLPQGPGAAYAELVRMGMPSGEGFNEKTFQKYYHR